MNRALTEGEIVLNQDYFDGSAPVDALEYPLDEVLFVHRLCALSLEELGDLILQRLRKGLCEDVAGRRLIILLRIEDTPPT